MSMLKFKKVFPEAIIPSKAHEPDAGWDLFVLPSFRRVTLGPGELVRAPTGIAFVFPKGKFGLIHSRSSSTTNGLMVEGIVDNGYTGQIYLQIRNVGQEEIEISGGKSYGQMILMDYSPDYSTLEEVFDVPATARGTKGFGASGNGHGC